MPLRFAEEQHRTSRNFADLRRRSAHFLHHFEILLCEAFSMCSNAGSAISTCTYSASVNFSKSNQNSNCSASDDDSACSVSSSNSNSSVSQEWTSEQFAANTYKTELCRSFKQSATCVYDASCLFAHGVDELRPRDFGNLKYKTLLCKNFHRPGGVCHFGSRCRFIHDEQRFHISSNLSCLVSPSDNLVRLETHSALFARQSVGSSSEVRSPEEPGYDPSVSLNFNPEPPPKQPPPLAAASNNSPCPPTSAESTSSSSSSAAVRVMSVPKAAFAEVAPLLSYSLRHPLQSAKPAVASSATRASVNPVSKPHSLSSASASSPVTLALLPPNSVVVAPCSATPFTVAGPSSPPATHPSTIQLPVGSRAVVFTPFAASAPTRSPYALESPSAQVDRVISYPALCSQCGFISSVCVCSSTAF